MSFLLTFAADVDNFVSVRAVSMLFMSVIQIYYPLHDALSMFFPVQYAKCFVQKKTTVSHNREFWLFPHLWNWSGLSGQQLIRFGICIVDDAAASKRFAALAALEHLSMLLKLHVQFCFCVFFYLPVFFEQGHSCGGGEQCVVRGVWQTLGSWNFCFFV